MNSFDEENIQIDEKKLRIMQNKIYMAERKNYKTGNYSHSRMIEELRKIIIEEHRKNIRG